MLIIIQTIIQHAKEECPGFYVEMSHLNEVRQREREREREIKNAIKSKAFIKVIKGS